MQTVPRAAIALVAIFAVFALTLSIFATGALAMSYSEWINQDEAWKRGYVFAFAEYRMKFANDAESIKYAEAYLECFSGFNDQALLKTVDQYLSRNPSEKTEPIIVAVGRALQELCANHLPKAER